MRRVAFWSAVLAATLACQLTASPAWAGRIEVDFEFVPGELFGIGEFDSVIGGSGTFSIDTSRSGTMPGAPRLLALDLSLSGGNLFVITMWRRTLSAPVTGSAAPGAMGQTLSFSRASFSFDRRVRTDGLGDFRDRFSQALPVRLVLASSVADTFGSFLVSFPRVEIPVESSSRLFVIPEVQITGREVSRRIVPEPSPLGIALVSGLWLAGLALAWMRPLGSARSFV